MADHTPPTDQQLADLHQQLTGPLGTATDVCGGTALRLVAEVRDHRAAQPIALPARWECSHGPSDDEAYCAEEEDDDHVCPTIRVHPSDAEAFAALVDEGHRLRTELAAALRPSTPRLCACGHSNFAHNVPAPHSCFAYGQTCPCPAFRQLPHDDAVAQLKRNQQAAAERAAAAVETHIVADDSDDPEHVDDCPGCAVGEEA